MTDQDDRNSVGGGRRRIMTRIGLPEGVYAIAVACAISGMAAWGFLILTARVLGPGRFTPLSQLWTLAFLLAPGTFLTVEQEVTRVVSERMTRGQGYGSAVRRTGAVGVVMCVGATAIVLACSPLLLSRLFDHDWWLMVGLVASLPSYLAMHLTWGVLSGSRRFTRYAWITGGEGILRLALAVVLVAVGVRSPGPFGVVVGVTPLLVVLVVGRVGAFRGDPGPSQSWATATRHLIHLLGGSFFNQTLLLVPPLVVAVLATRSEKAQAGRLVVAMVLVRVPLFLFNAVLASLLSQLARSAASTDHDALTQALRRLLAIVIPVALVGTVVAALAGPPVLRILFGPGYRLGALDLGLLAAGCGCFMVGLTFGQALIAQALHAKTTVSWGIGLVAFGIALLVRMPLLHRVEVAFVAGCALAAAAMAVQTVAAGRRMPAIGDPDARAVFAPTP